MTERLLSAVLNQSMETSGGIVASARFSSWRGRRRLLSRLTLSKLFVCLLGPHGYRSLSNRRSGFFTAQTKFWQQGSPGISAATRVLRLQTRRRAAATSTTTSERPPGLGAASRCLLSVF